MRFSRCFVWIGVVVGLCTFAVTSKADQQKPKEWAFLIFMNGHNNLSSFTDLNINQLETVGSTADIDVVVQWAKLGAKNTYRLHIQKDDDMNKVTSPVIETMPRQDMGDYRNLVEFVRWAQEKYPAKHYMVSFWNHGSGWHRQVVNPVRAISSDDYTGHSISTEEMGVALDQIAKIIGHRVEIVGADACLMAMEEVASEMHGSVDYFVASEELVPGLGWPYHWFYERWAKNPKADGAEVTRYLVEEYYKYLGPKDDITLSSINVQKLPILWESLRGVLKSVENLSAAQLVKLRAATEGATKFAYTDYVDLGHWLKKAKGVMTKDHDTISAAESALTASIVANKVTAKYAAAEGAAVWVPPTKDNWLQYEKRYAGLRFAKETGWGEWMGKLATLPLCTPHEHGQWAKAVTSFSSQYGDLAWSASQVLGACDTATYGDHNTAWTPRVQDGGLEYVSVSFGKPVRSTGAVIRETYGNGFVTKVETIDASGKETTVWAGTDPSTTGAVADLLVEWPRTEYAVHGLKVTVDTGKILGVWKQIDSIQLVGE